jgi:hypothetical protein
MSVIYMGQIMAECDCQHHACEIRGYCMAEKIEELGAKRDEVERRRVKWMNKSDELQTKLAKAMAALEWVVSAKGLTDPTEYGYGAIKHARVVLEEIKGET